MENEMNEVMQAVQNQLDNDAKLRMAEARIAELERTMGTLDRMNMELGEVKREAEHKLAAFQSAMGISDILRRLGELEDNDRAFTYRVQDALETMTERQWRATSVTDVIDDAVSDLEFVGKDEMSDVVRDAIDNLEFTVSVN